MNLGGDAVRELVECLYTAMDRQDWSRVEAMVSPRVVVEVGSSAPTGWDEWRGDLEAFYRGFPDGRHVIEEILVVGSHQCAPRGPWALAVGGIGAGDQ